MIAPRSRSINWSQLHCLARDGKLHIYLIGQLLMPNLKFIWCLVAKLRNFWRRSCQLFFEPPGPDWRNGGWHNHKTPVLVVTNMHPTELWWLTNMHPCIVVTTTVNKATWLPDKVLLLHRDSCHCRLRITIFTKARGPPQSLSGTKLSTSSPPTPTVLLQPHSHF